MPPAGLEEEFAPLTAVHIAHYFSDGQEQKDDAYARTEIDTDYLTRFGIAERVEEFWEIAHAE